MLMRCDNNGYEMTLETSTGIYQLLEDGAVVKESKSLDMIEKYISSGGVDKEKKKHKRVPILYNKYGDYIKGEATSIAEKARLGGLSYFWIICGGNRSKESTVILDTPENEAIITKIKLKNIERQGLAAEINALEKQFILLTHEMMEEGGEEKC